MSSKEYRDLKAAMDRQGERLLALADDFKLHIKGHPKPAPAPKPGPRYYTVKAGDYASRIAERHNLSLGRFQALNPGGPPSGDWNLIHPGEKYRVA